MVIQHRQDRHLNAHSIFLNASKSRLFLSHAAIYTVSLNVFCTVDCTYKSAVYTARRLPRPAVCILLTAQGIVRSSIPYLFCILNCNSSCDFRRVQADQGE